MKSEEITLVVSSEEAEELLIALRMRASQRNVTGDIKQRCETLRQQINSEAERAFKWDKFPDRWKENGEIRVTVTTRNRW